MIIVECPVVLQTFFFIGHLFSVDRFITGHSFVMISYKGIEISSFFLLLFLQAVFVVNNPEA